MRIDLIRWQRAAEVPNWRHGQTLTLPLDPSTAALTLESHLRRTGAEWLLFWDGPERSLPLDAFRRRATEAVDAVHGGLRAGLAGQPEELDYLDLDWSWLNPPTDRACTSWRLSLRCAMIRTETLRALGGLDPAFETLVGCGLELGYRLLRRGAAVYYDPACAPALPGGLPPTQVDAMVLIRRWFKPHWSRYVRFRGLLSGRNPLAVRAASRRALQACERWPGPDHDAVAPERRGADQSLPSRPSITAVIPTLGRYPYVGGALDTLARQTVPPTEILVVDQNGPDERQPQVYEPYSHLPLRVIWQDERGQSRARNAALAEARGDYVFLFEDDVSAGPDLLEQHLRVMEAWNADVSTGVSIPPPPTDYELPEEFRFPRLAQTFSSGNALLSREALRLAGGFDRNYDHGVNADMDFGTRLYLAGGVIVHNPHASMIHYKAPMGGLRVYGHWWAHSNLGLFKPFPPPTQLYYMLRHLTPRQRRERLFRFLALAALGWDKRQSHQRGSRAARAARGLATLPLMPYRLARAYAEANALYAAGPRIPGTNEASALRTPAPAAVLHEAGHHR